LDNVPPNLTLNIGGAIPDKSLVLGFACLGVMLQAVVIVVNALAQAKWGLLRTGASVPPKGLILWAVGTASLSIGIYLYSWMVESSHRKRTVRPLNSDPVHFKPMRVLFLQQAIPEENSPAYAIEPIRAGGNIQISRRYFPPTSKDAILKQERA
jgi:hypothetical protein